MISLQEVVAEDAFPLGDTGIKGHSHQSMTGHKILILNSIKFK
jgi:hypothetical protein